MTQNSLGAFRFPIRAQDMTPTRSDPVLAEAWAVEQEARDFQLEDYLERNRRLTNTYVADTSSFPTDPLPGQVAFVGSDRSERLWTGTAPWVILRAPAWGEPYNYNPTLAGGSWAIGNGSKIGLWTRVGRKVDLILRINWGSTSASDAVQALRVSLPLPIDLTYTSYQGEARGFDSAVNNFLGTVYAWDSDEVFFSWIVTSTGVTSATITGVPFAALNGGDFIEATISYFTTADS